MIPFNIYSVGAGGVNLVKHPLRLADDELTKGQNAEFVLDSSNGGLGTLGKRGGLVVLNADAMAGSILGLFGVTLKSTYTRTLLAARGTQDANTFIGTTNGTTWVDTPTPLAAADIDKYTDNDSDRDARRMVSFRNFILYPGNIYVQDTDPPEINVWDGILGQRIVEIDAAHEDPGNEAFAITDMLVANGKIYFAIHDAGAGAAPNLQGRVMSLDLESGAVSQVANAFGARTQDMPGGYPSALAFYRNQLFVGLNGGTTTDGIGKIVRCFPTLDTVWTADVINLRNHISSLAVFEGDLYAGTRSSVSAGATISRRSALTATWATVATSGGGAAGEGHYASITVQNINNTQTAFAVEYWSGATDIVHIVTSVDGITWTTSRDVDANDSMSDPPQTPGSMAVFNNALYVVFRANTVSAADGFIMQLSGGTWTKVLTDNLSGQLAVLLEVR